MREREREREREGGEREERERERDIMHNLLILYFDSYYRYVLEPDLTFESDGSLTSGPVARFMDLPQKSILTMGVNPPESWLVESVKAAYDLDNILLEEVRGRWSGRGYDDELITDLVTYM